MIAETQTLQVWQSQSPKKNHNGFKNKSHNRDAEGSHSLTMCIATKTHVRKRTRMPQMQRMINTCMGSC